MCTGTILQFGIAGVVIGDNVSFKGEVRNGLDAEALMAAEGIEVTVLNDPAWIELFRQWQAANPRLWSSDIGR